MEVIGILGTVQDAKIEDKTLTIFQRIGYDWEWEPNFLLERGDKAEKEGERETGVQLKMGGCYFFIALQFSHIYSVCVGKVKFPLLLFNSLVFLVSHVKFLSKSL